MERGLIAMRPGPFAQRSWGFVRRNWPAVAFTVVIVVPLLWMGGALAARSDMLRFAGTVTPDQIRVFATFLAGAFAAAATLFTTLITRTHNERERRRLVLEAVIRSIEALPDKEPKTRVAGVLSTLVLLGQERIALRVLQPAWEDGLVEEATATWLIGQVLTGDGTYGAPGDGDRTDRTAITEASVLLAEHADRLTGTVAGQYYFPGHFMWQWRTRRNLPPEAKEQLLIAMGRVLLSRDPEWWRPAGGPPGWPTEVLVEAAEKDRSRSVRSSAALLLAALHECFPEEFEARLHERRLARMLRYAEDARTRLPDEKKEHIELADRISRAWKPSPNGG